MDYKNIPIENPKPDSKKFIDILLGNEDGSKPRLVEYLVDQTLMQPILENMVGRKWVPPSGPEAWGPYFDNFIEFWYRMGYDFVRFESALPFPMKKLVTGDTGSQGDRAWADEHTPLIANWNDFEKYKWPKLEEMNFGSFEYISKHLPEGMGMITCHAAGVYEHLSFIMSYEGLCYALYESPDLVKAVTDRIGELMLGFYQHLLTLDNVIAIFPGDDMGFRSGTLIGPDHLRQYILPWHKRFAALTHEKGIPYFLHSCGFLEEIMEDLIEDVKIDGKHSYEDTIIPIEKFQKKYGERIAVLGGMDVGVLSSGSPEDVRTRAKHLLKTCGAKGRFALGSGNSIPSYVPLENYLSMVDEVHGFGTK